jgi:hypothetical protein
MPQQNTIPDPTLEAFINLLTDTFKLEILFALSVYGLDLGKLERKLFKTPEPEQIGWRAVAVDKGRSLVASEIPMEWADQSPVSFTRGTIVEQSLEAFRLLSQHFETRAAFPRQLRVSALRLDTFWVKKSAEAKRAIVKEDIILPFTRFPLENALKPQDGKTFLRHVQDAAERRREGNDRKTLKRRR